MNGQRQFMAIAIVFLSMEYAYKRKYIKTILLVSLAIIFHQSAFLMIPVYIGIWIFDGKKFYIISAMFLVLIRVGLPYFLNILSSTSILSYGSKDVERGIKSARISIPNIFIASVILLTCFLLKKRILSKKENVFYIKFVWISLLLFVLLSNLGSAVTRICFYFTSVYILLIPDIMKIFNKKVEYIVSRIVLWIVCYGYIYVLLVNSIATGNDFYPYRSFW